MKNNDNIFAPHATQQYPLLLTAIFFAPSSNSNCIEPLQYSLHFQTSLDFSILFDRVRWNMKKGHTTHSVILGLEKRGRYHWVRPTIYDRLEPSRPEYIL